MDPSKEPIDPRVARLLEAAGLGSPPQSATLSGELAKRLADVAARKRITTEALLNDIVKRYLDRAERKK
jgi:hypothetical protein